MRDEKRALTRLVVVQAVHDLRRRIRLPRPGRTDDHGQSRVQTGANRFNLYGREPDLVRVRLIFRIRTGIRADVRFHFNRVLSLVFWFRKRDTKWCDVLLRLVLPRNFMIRERFHEVLLIQESVFEINRVQGFVCVQQRRGGGIAVTQKHVVQPLWNADVGVHQVSNARQDRLEVIFFRFAAHEHVQPIVDVFASFFLLASRPFDTAPCRAQA